MDVELDIENTGLSPGVRRMMAAVGQEAAFAHGRQQMELLAGLSVSTKAVERTAEAIGGDIEASSLKTTPARNAATATPVKTGQPAPMVSHWKLLAEANLDSLF